MMFLTSLLILISLGGSFGEENCNQREMTECESQRNALLDIWYPENAEDLLKTCKLMQKLGNCLADVRESCDDVIGMLDMRELVSYLSSACEEDNPTFKVISSNLGCVINVLEKTGGRHCAKLISEEGNDALNDLIPPPYQDEYKGSHFERCFSAAIEVECLYHMFGQLCGVEVRDAVFEVQAYFATEFHGYPCTPEMVDELDSLDTAFEAILKEEFQLQDSLEKKRK